MYDVIVIGAGPSGAVASAMLARKGYRTLVLERDQFPRFSIGESLLPHCMEFIEEAGMSAAVYASGFQKKNGARFLFKGCYSNFDFNKKFTDGPSETFQVTRADFDKVLADEAEKYGADIRYKHEIVDIVFGEESVSIECKIPTNKCETFEAKFILDASGFGRVLPRLLGLERPSSFPVRASLFCHLEDHIHDKAFDRDKILITVHPRHKDVWYWLIPFSNGRCSIGVVAEPDYIEGYSGDLGDRLRSIVDEEPDLSILLKDANWLDPVRQIVGYSSNVSKLFGDRFALLGNAGEFLDPVFSSGVTIALRSASAAAGVLDRQLRGETVNWETDYADPLKRGIETFRSFVNAWYDGSFQDIIFYEKKSTEISSMISSVLAGYAWDLNNPFVSNSERRLKALSQFCSSSRSEG
jgi:flavin-dependent dehydrogenase